MNLRPYELITQKLSGRISAEGEAELNAWLKADEQNAEFYKVIARLWDAPKEEESPAGRPTWVWLLLAGLAIGLSVLLWWQLK